MARTPPIETADRAIVAAEERQADNSSCVSPWQRRPRAGLTSVLSTCARTAPSRSDCMLGSRSRPAAPGATWSSFTHRDRCRHLAQDGSPHVVSVGLFGAQPYARQRKPRASAAASSPGIGFSRGKDWREGQPEILDSTHLAAPEGLGRRQEQEPEALGRVLAVRSGCGSASA